MTDVDCYKHTGYVVNSTDCDDTAIEVNTADDDGDGYTSCESDCDDSDATIGGDC